MDFGTPILALAAVLFTASFGVTAIGVGFSTRHYRALSPTFFSNLEIISGALILLLHLVGFLSAGGQESDEFWIKSQAAMTIWMMLLAICHLLEIRRAIAPPLSIVVLGYLNLRGLQYMWYLVTEYEATW